MKKSVTLKILNKQYTEKLEQKGEAYERALNLDDQFEIITEGTMYEKAGATYLSYEESREAGLDNSHTIIRVGDQRLNIRRFGEDETGTMDLRLEPGVLHVTRYHVPAASLDLEVFTNRLTEELDGDGYGTIFADYNIKMEPLFNRRNQLTIDVMPDRAGWPEPVLSERE